MKKDNTSPSPENQNENTRDISEQEDTSVSTMSEDDEEDEEYDEDGDEIVRILVNGDEDMDTAYEALDEAMIGFDVDSGGRLMIHSDYVDEAIAALEEAGFDADII